MSENLVTKHYHIEMKNDAGVWVDTGHYPQPLDTRDSPYSLGFQVWINYVDFLNAREADKDGNPFKRFRISEWIIRTEKVIVYA